MSQVWLIGRPVSHSLSPAMHNAAFAALGLPHRYEAREVADNDLAPTLQRMRSEDVLGANVTIPHKEAVLRGVDEVSDEASRIGGLNTMVHMWAYDSLEERTKRRAQLMQDQRWLAFIAKLRPLILSQENKLLIPMSFSPPLRRK